MVSAEWGAFVVSCMPMIRAEAERFVRLGARLDVDDAVQEVAAELLADEDGTDGRFVAHRIRSRIRDLIRASRRKKRAAREISIDHVPEALALGGLGCVESCAIEVIEKIDAEKLLDLWPASGGGDRAARRMRERWLPIFQEFAKRGAA